MNETFEKVERHLYKRVYKTSNGDWSTKFYAIFTDWKGVRRRVAAGDSLEDARDEFGRLKTLNKGRHDWDKEKEERHQQESRMTLSAWGKRYFDEMIDPGKHLLNGSGLSSNGSNPGWGICS